MGTLRQFAFPSLLFFLARQDDIFSNLGGITSRDDQAAA